MGKKIGLTTISLKEVYIPLFFHENKENKVEKGRRWKK